MRCSIRGCVMAETRLTLRGTNTRLWLAGGWLLFAGVHDVMHLEQLHRLLGDG